jgi:hypothetical protein
VQQLTETAHVDAARTGNAMGAAVLSLRIQAEKTWPARNKHFACNSAALAHLLGSAGSPGTVMPVLPLVRLW